MYLGYLNGTHIGGSNNQQVYGNFEGPISLRIHVWVGNIITPDVSGKKTSKKSSPIKNQAGCPSSSTKPHPQKDVLGGGFQRFFIFAPKILGKRSNLTCAHFNWVEKNHRLENVSSGLPGGKLKPGESGGRRPLGDSLREAGGEKIIGGMDGQVVDGHPTLR